MARPTSVAIIPEQPERVAAERSRPRTAAWPPVTESGWGPGRNPLKWVMLNGIRVAA
jgi:hypothetical protein